MTRSIKILGAGPAGLTAAIVLAQHGFQPIVYEKRSRCGARFKGDLQGLENWSSEKDILDEFRAIGLQINFAHSPFTQLHGVDYTLKVATLAAEQPLFYLVKRGPFPDSLDTGLYRQAMDHAVDLRFERTIPETEADIIATGPASTDIFAVDTGIVFETDLPDVAYGMLNNNNAYLGYAYLLVTGGYGCMCTVLFDRYPDIHRQFEQVKRDFIALTGVTINNPRTVGGFGAFSHRRRYEQQGRLYVGEAAGLQDLLWGFGLRYAVRSGHLAAQAIIQGTDYAQAVSGALTGYLRASTVNRFIWEHLGNRGYRFFMNLGRRNRDPRRFLFKLFRYSTKQRVLFPLARWDLSRRHRHLSS